MGDPSGLARLGALAGRTEPSADPVLATAMTERAVRVEEEVLLGGPLADRKEPPG